MIVMSALEAMRLVGDGAVVVPGGFGCCGHPDLLTEALAERFEGSGHPSNLTLLFASGAGDKRGLGLDRLSAPGMVRRAVGGFWGFCPALAELGRRGVVSAHNWPMGVISHLFRDIASGLSGRITHIGLDTFIDPRLEGGVLCQGEETLVSVVDIKGEESLYYPGEAIDFALLRGTFSDQEGNISMSGEAALHDAYWQAMAARNTGGRVVFQVQGMVDKLAPDAVDVPAHLVDIVVVGGGVHHASYGSSRAVGVMKGEDAKQAVHKDIIVQKAVEEPLPTNAFVNFGIGIPALVGERVVWSGGEGICSSVESGVIGGRPKEGLSFGEVEGFGAMVQQADIFSFYDGGGIDVAFLGFAEIDAHGNVNASSFGGNVTGAGGFINIALSADKLVLCGTMTTKGLRMARRSDGGYCMVARGEITKFVDHVGQVTIATNTPLFWKKEIKVITELGVFLLHKGRLVLLELTPGVSIQDVKDCVSFEFDTPEIAA